MSDQELENKVEETKVETKEENQTIDVEALVKKMEVLESTNNRLLEESKSYKDKYRQVRDAVEQDKTAKLEQDENYKELLDIEKNKRSEIEQQLLDAKKKSMKKDLNFKVASMAKDAANLDVIMKVLPKEHLAIDESTGDFTGVEEALNSLRQSDPYLFQQNKSTGMTSKRPDAYKEQTIDDKIAENPSAMLNDILSEFMK